jgi:hypothetical protein
LMIQMAGKWYLMYELLTWTAHPMSKLVLLERAIIAKREAEKPRKYRLVPVANAGATFKPFFEGSRWHTWVTGS